jgi:tetratricopeptide (TPR) repeat protein
LEYSLTYRLARCRDSTYATIYEGSRVFSLQEAAPRITALAQDLVAKLRGEFPRHEVAVVRIRGNPLYRAFGSKPPQDSIGAQLTALLNYRLSTSDKFVGGDTVGAEFIVSGDVRALRSSVGASVTLRSRGLRPRRDSVRISGTLDSLDAFYIRAANSVFDKLQQLVQARELATATSLADLTVDSLVTLGRAAACLDVSSTCAPRLDAAIAVWQAALSKDSTQVGLYVNLGRAWQLKGSTPRALQDFARGDTARQRLARSGQPVSREILRDLAIGLGEAYRSSGNLEKALEAYDTALSAASLAAADSALVLGRVATLRVLGRPVQAMQTMLRAMAFTPGLASYNSELQVVLQQFSPAELAAFGPALSAACANPDSLRSICLSAFRAAGERSLHSDADPRTARELYNAALRLAAADSVRFDVLTHIASCFLASVSIDSAEGKWSVTVEGGNPDSASAFVDSARHVSGLLPSHEALLERITARILRDQKKYAEAAQQVHDAELVMRTADGALLEAEVAYAQATAAAPVGSSGAFPSSIAAEMRHAQKLLQDLVLARVEPADQYYRDASHRLGLEAEARATFERALQTAPLDESVYYNLAFLCQEYMFDPSCSFNVAQRSISLGLRTASSDSIEAGEAAVLSGHFAEARSWLVASAHERTGSCYAPVGAFYLFWTASGLGNRDEASRYFDTWSAATTAMRGAKIPMRECWVFNGAKRRVAATDTPVDWQLLRRMIGAMENPSDPLPTNNASPVQVRP